MVVFGIEFESLSGHRWRWATLLSAQSVRFMKIKLLTLALLLFSANAESHDYIVSIAYVSPDPEIPENVRKMFADDDGRPLVSDAFDLNGDGVQEKFIPNEFLCGNGGCPWLIYSHSENRVIGSIFGSIINVLVDEHDGFKDISVSYHMGSDSEVIEVFRYSKKYYEKFKQ